MRSRAVDRVWANAFTRAGEEGGRNLSNRTRRSRASTSDKASLMAFKAFFPEAKALE